MMGPREKYKKADETRRKQTARSRLGPAPIKLHCRLFKLVRFSFVKKRKESPKSIMPFLFHSLSIRLSSLSLGFGYLKADCIPIFLSCSSYYTQPHRALQSSPALFSLSCQLGNKVPPTNLSHQHLQISILLYAVLNLPRWPEKRKFDLRPVDCQPSTSWPILWAHTAQRTHKQTASTVCDLLHSHMDCQL